MIKYEKLHKNEYNDFFLESKHIKVQDDFIDLIWKALQNSSYTKGELAERLEWDLDRLNMVLSGDKTIDFYEATHLAGALGYQFKVNIKEINDE